MSLTMVYRIHATIASCFILLALSSSLSIANVKITPFMLFVNEPRRSVAFDVLNITERDIEITVEMKYGYVTSDDSNRIIIKMMDTTGVDDPSCSGWITMHPSRFVLKAGEKQAVRLVIDSSAASVSGEYWSRVLVTSKPLIASSKTPNSGQPGIGVEIRNQQSIPLHYRKGVMTTDVTLVGEPDVDLQGKKIIFTEKYERTGNSSYWGRVRFELKDGSGKVVLRSMHNLVVYKDIVLSYTIDVSDIPSGNYVLDANIETVRTDDAERYLVKAKPKFLQYSITIQ